MGQTKSSQQNGGSCQRMKEVIQGDNQVRLLLKEIKAEKKKMKPSPATNWVTPIVQTHCPCWLRLQFR